MSENFKELLRNKMDGFVHEVFDVAASFPRGEIYITTSQIKRAALSIVLNYTEGYARFKKKNQLNFLEISYGSMKETKYLLYFAQKRNFFSKERYDVMIKQLDEIGAMLWTEIAALSKSVEEVE